MLGKCSQVKIDKKRTVLLGGHGKIKRHGDELSILDARIAFLEDILASDLVGDSQRDEISERISKLRGGLILIQPGGRSELEVSECQDRIEDAVCAVHAAIKSGFVVGGGAALLHASATLNQLSTNKSMS